MGNLSRDPVPPRFWLALALVLFAASARADDTAPVDLSDDLEALLTAPSTPALLALVTDEQRVVAHGAAGFRIRGRPERIQIDDPIHIGSITKPFTATLVAELVDQGKLRWDETLAETLPELAPAMRPDYRAVTLAQLLTHEAGIQPFDDEASPEVVGMPKLEGEARIQRRLFAAYALSLEPALAPGSGFLYSNAGFAVAAAVIESAVGRSWEELMRERLFVPLGMNSAGFGWPNSRDPNAPWGHVEKEGQLAPTPPDDPYRLPLWIAPAGDLSMSLPDLAKFARLHLLGFDGNAALLRAETFRTMHTKRLRSGLGWGVTSLLGHEPVSTFSGSAGTFFAIIALVHDADMAVLVAANAADEATQSALKSELKQLVVRFAGDKTPPAPKP